MPVTKSAFAAVAQRGSVVSAAIMAGVRAELCIRVVWLRSRMPAGGGL